MTAPTLEPIATRFASLVPCTGPRMVRASLLMSIPFEESCRRFRTDTVDC